MSNYFDLDMIKQISLLNVLDQYGIEIDKHNFFKIRNEHTASTRYYPETNSWYDFGSNAGGGIIDLVKHIEQVDTKQAIQIIGTQFAVPTQVKEKGKKYLSNKQYELIGLYGDRAGKNYDFQENGQDLFSVYTKELRYWIKPSMARILLGCAILILITI